jgi:hypothetical protein
MNHVSLLLQRQQLSRNSHTCSKSVQALESLLVFLGILISNVHAVHTESSDRIVLGTNWLRVRTLYHNECILNPSARVPGTCGYSM